MADNSPSQPPRDFRSLRDLLVSSRDALPKRLAQVAAYAIESPDDIAFGTAASIAENAAVQPSTLVRFAKALGYQGFTELQSVFQERLRDRPSNYDDRLQSLVSHAAGPAVGTALIEGFSSAAIRSVEQMRARVDAATLEEACRLLAGAETIYLIAQRRAFPITSYMSYAFGKLGIKTVLIGSGAGTDVETLSFAGPKDAAFAVSFTPYASATVDFARQVARQNVPLVVITDSPFSPLVPEKGVWFEVVEADFEGFRSLAATMSLALSLTVGTAEMRRTKPE